jgi:hypothetical protein
MAGVLSVPPNKARMARSFGATGPQVFFLITMPASMPYIFTGMRLAMGNSFATVVAAEMLAANNGLGYLIASSQMWLEITTIFSGLCRRQAVPVVDQPVGGPVCSSIDFQPLRARHQSVHRRLDVIHTEAIGDDVAFSEPTIAKE